MGVWFDDEMPEHVKIEALGDDDAARWLHVAAIFYCNRNQTGGWIEKGKALRLTAQASQKRIDKLLAVLVPGKGPLWEESGGRYYIHDYEEHQRSAEKRRAEAEEAKRRRSEHARRAAQARHGATNEQGSSMDRADFEQPTEHPPEQEIGHEVSNGQAGGGALPKHAQALAPPRVRRAPGPLPLTPVNRSSSSLHGVGDEPAEEEEPQGRLEQAVAVVAQRRMDRRLTKPDLEPITDRSAWLATARARERQRIAEDPAYAANMAKLVADPTLSVAQLADLIDPPEPRPTSPYPEAGQASEPAWDLDEHGLAVARIAP